MRHLVSFVISFIVVILIFICPFPGVVSSENTITVTKNNPVKDFTIMSYTMLSEIQDPPRVDNEKIKKDEFLMNRDNTNKDNPREDEIEKNHEESIETGQPDETGNTDGEETTVYKTIQEESQNMGGPDIVDYNPDFSVNKKPVYPVAAKRMRQQGSVKLKITTDGTGSITDIEIEKSSGYVLLDNAAIDAVEKWEFEPIVKDGRFTIIRTEIIFTLRKK